MEQKVWVLHDTYNGRYLVYNDADALKKALGALAFEYWKLNGELDEDFTTGIMLEEVSLNKVDTEW